ncbi:hypothetical protein B0H17DRAFT_1218196 [Mycena rosella]|uniref:Uncharacterized protein n=1 Tax=Mycena rosella TaxID=1033263 RepID=A0AAD7FKN3_MYCRO|nr:hypothetical protein B0H17DRAFT_1218196 [Mycena rosella]
MSAIVPRIKTPLYPTLVHVGLKNIATDVCTSLAIVLQLPNHAFASQILRALWMSSSIVQTVSAKWTPSRIFVACSRKMVPIDNPDHNRPSTGFQELGRYDEIIGTPGIIVVGGRADKTVPSVLSSPDLVEMKSLYEVGGSTQSFSLYLFYMDQDALTAGITAASHAATSLHSAPTVKNASAPLALCKAIYNSELGPAYKMYAGVRLMPEIVQDLGGGAWAKKGMPTPFFVSEPQFPGLQMSIDHLLAFCKAPASSTFANHCNWVKNATQVFQLLQNATSPALSTDESGRAQILYALLYAPLLDPSSPTFSISPDYSRLVEASIAETKGWVHDFEERFGSRKASR